MLYLPYGSWALASSSIGGDTEQLVTLEVHRGPNILAVHIGIFIVLRAPGHVNYLGDHFSGLPIANFTTTVFLCLPSNLHQVTRRLNAPTAPMASQEHLPIHQILQCTVLHFSEITPNKDRKPILQ